ncbi:MAG: hypothetical protein ACRDD3_09025 [Azovibrio sp.]
MGKSFRDGLWAGDEALHHIFSCPDKSAQVEIMVNVLKWRHSKAENLLMSISKMTKNKGLYIKGDEIQLCIKINVNGI